MRVATMIIGLMLAVLCGLQSFIVSMVGSGLGEKATEGGGSLGMVVAFFLMLGAAFVLNLPLVSTIMFSIGGLIGTTGSLAAFPDLAAWGWVSVILALMSLVAVFIKRRQKRKAREVEAPEPIPQT
jgi:hypothetical protein